jgi:phosphinothricin acetyltransferase
MGPSACRIRDARPEDGDALARVYNPYILGSVVTFEETPVSGDEMARRVDEVGRVPLPWLVAEREGRLVGYAYGTRWKPRASYRHAAECAVYLEEGSVGRGIGRGLYDALMPRLRAAGIHVVIAGVALPNPASVALHERCGFLPVGTFREVGRKHGRWIDVAYWQRGLDDAGPQP